jgi:hypothetical protein
MNRPQVVGPFDDLFRQQKPGGQLAVRAGRPHRHDERCTLETNFERFLDRRHVVPCFGS